MAVYLGVAVGTLSNWSLPSGVNMELVRTKTSMIFNASNKKQLRLGHVLYSVDDAVNSSSGS